MRMTERKARYVIEEVSKMESMVVFSSISNDLLEIFLFLARWSLRKKRILKVKGGLGLRGGEGGLWWYVSNYCMNKP